MLNAKDGRVKKTNRLKALPNPIFTKKGDAICLVGFQRNVYFELLPDSTTINSEVYCHRLDNLNDSFKKKRPELINRKSVVFHQDNARTHTSFLTGKKLLQFRWGIMPHPPYFPNLALSDYYLF